MISIDTKAALEDNIKLQNAEFELGSAQFDVPPIMFKEKRGNLDTLSNVAISEAAQSVLLKRKKKHLNRQKLS